MRFLDLRNISDPRERGRVHGQSYAGEIGSLVEIRTYLGTTISGFDHDELLAIADKHLPVLKAYDEDLYEELLGIAEGSGRSASEIVVLNHYTDIRDLKPDTEVEGQADFDGGCTILWGKTDVGPIFGQTWDMHASAMPYVMMLRVPDAGGGDAWLLSLVGCLGMAGLNKTGVGVGINNLTSTDARIGVPWSAIVRKMLRSESAAGGKEVLWETQMGSGHHYLVGDSEDVFSIETSGEKKQVIFAGESASFAHSNHCLDGEIAACSRVPVHSSTYVRQEAMEKSLAETPLKDAEDAWERLGSTEGYPRSICTNVSTPTTPHAAATCAGLVIDYKAKRLLCVAGLTNKVPPEIYEFVG